MTTKPSKSILVVEDQTLLNKLLVLEIKRLGHAVDGVFNGLDALDQLLKASYDLIVTDLFMPELDGIELIKKIRERNLHMPIVVISASAYEEVKEKLSGHGVVHYIDKPLTDAKLRLLSHYIENA